MNPSGTNKEMCHGEEVTNRIGEQINTIWRENSTKMRTQTDSVWLEWRGSGQSRTRMELREKYMVELKKSRSSVMVNGKHGQCFQTTVGS